MKTQILQFLPAPVSQLVPPLVKQEMQRQLSRWRGLPTARHLRAARGQRPVFLGLNDLEALQRAYPAPPAPRYGLDALQSRGAERADFLRLVASRRLAGNRTRALEVGCLDGMVSGQLRENGWQAAAIDMASHGFDRRARAAGAWLMAMDATRLGFPDDCFDLTFSYDAFEHMADPQAALDEMIRVTGPGGLIYLNFGPLYNSPYGLHAYRSVRVPFCQFLFESSTLDAFCRRHDLPAIKYHQLNGWSLARFRALWRRCAGRLHRLHYRESWSSAGMELVAQYPACFGAVESVEELSVDHIEALFRVKG